MKAARSGPPEVAFIVKGYPRLSETFILNEIHLLEQMGIPLRIYSLKKETEGKRQGVVDRIAAPVRFLGEDAASEDVSFGTWLRINLPRYLASHRKLLRRRPGRYLQALQYALLGLGLRFHLDRAPSLKRTAIKDFLRAGHIAADLVDHPDVRHLHAHFCHGSTTMAFFAGHITGIPFSFTAHAKDIYLPKLNPGGLLRVKIEAAEFVVTCTDANRRHLERLSPGSAIRTIYHGLDTERFAPPDRTAPRAGRPVLLSVGRLVPKKGFPTLIRACAVLRDRGIDFSARIIGPAGSDSARVAALVDELDLGEIVTIEGAMTQEGLRAAFGTSTVMALACEVAPNGDRDGIPNVLVEAMAMATPVVATRVSGIPELVEDDVTGLLVNERSPVELGDAIERLFADAPLRLRLGRTGRRRVRDRFDSGTTTQELAGLFARRLGIAAATEPNSAYIGDESRAAS
ncbi:MAG: glycosyltransferase family 4 protein [Acidimicrobiia bacterium]